MDDFEKMTQVVHSKEIGYAARVKGSRRRRRAKRSNVSRMRICRCGNLFEPKSWQIKHHHDKLCPSCTPKDPRWSSEYQSQRSLRMLKAHYKCEECGSKKKLECHHVNGDPSDHSLNNLRILCSVCHQPHTNVQRAVRNMSTKAKAPQQRRRPTKSMRLM